MGNKKKPLSAGNFLIPVSSTVPVAGAVGPAGPFGSFGSVGNTLSMVNATTNMQNPGMTQQGIPGNTNMPSQQQTGGVDPISQTIMSLNSNPYLIGVFMLFLNLGGRFLSLELSKKQEAFLQQSWLRPFLFFIVIFIATRNLVVAFWVTLLFFFVIWIVANENSRFCMIPSWCGHDIKGEKEKYEKNIQKL